MMTPKEFRERNDGFNRQLRELERQIALVHEEAEKSRLSEARLEEIRAALERELSFQKDIHAGLVTAILDHIVVRRESSREVLHLNILLKSGACYEAVFRRSSAELQLSPGHAT